MSTTRRQRLQRRRRWVLISAATLVGACSLAYALGVFSPETAEYVPAPEQSISSTPPEHVDGSHTASRTGGVLLTGHEPMDAPETEEHAPESTGESTEGAMSVEDSRGRFVVESVGLSVGLSQQGFPDDGVLTPADFESAWEVVSPAKGWQGTRDGVRLITMHSSSSIASAPGNALVRDGSPLMGPGAMFSVDGVQYEVESAQIVTKGEIPAQVFEDVAGRLVVVTCSPQGTKSSTDNVVIVAHEAI